MAAPLPDPTPRGARRGRGAGCTASAHRCARCLRSCCGTSSSGAGCPTSSSRRSRSRSPSASRTNWTRLVLPPVLSGHVSPTSGILTREPRVGIRIPCPEATSNARLPRRPRPGAQPARGGRPRSPRGGPGRRRAQQAMRGARRRRGPPPGLSGEGAALWGDGHERGGRRPSPGGQRAAGRAARLGVVQPLVLPPHSQVMRGARPERWSLDFGGAERGAGPGEGATRGM